MPELICHLFGDYFLQNHWMATNKTKAWFPAAVHAMVYTLIFLCLTRNPVSLLLIGGTHVVIDRFRLARYWVNFWGVGCEGYLPGAIARFSRSEPISPAPDFLAVWLLILVDNTVHLTINHFALML